MTPAEHFTPIPQRPAPVGHSGWVLWVRTRFFADWNSFMAEYPDWFTRIDDVSDFARAKAAGKVGIATPATVARARAMAFLRLRGPPACR